MADTTIIAPNGDAWAHPSKTEPLVAELEQRLGVRLPEPYRSFLVHYDGGAPYPLIFNDPRDPDDPERFLDRFLSSNAIATIHSGEVFSGGEPKGFVVIGEDPGGLSVVLSLGGADAGAVYAWEQSSMPWGGEGNGAADLVPLAKGFSEFVGQLYETADKMGWEHWNIPVHVELQRDLNLVSRSQP